MAMSFQEWRSFLKLSNKAIASAYEETLEQIQQESLLADVLEILSKN
jgi:hypothetical protein